jgi:hypothetical protein
MSSLYEEFTPEEARRLIEKIQVVHTPKHGRWLNMAECELRNGTVITSRLALPLNTPPPAKPVAI